MKPLLNHKAKLFIGIIYKDSKVLDGVLKTLIESLGGVEKESEEYDFTKFTDYYKSEIGSGLKKKFFVFRNLIDPSEIADIKLFTNKIEDRISVNNKRKINLDPGYLTEHKLVLATAKERAHKIYLGKGMFADLTYLFNKKEAVVFGHTFPDFKSDYVRKFFHSLRQELVKKKILK